MRDHRVVRVASRENPAGIEPDGETLEACRRGDRAALERVLVAESQRIERLLVRMVGGGADAEDLLHEVFVAAMEGFPRFRGEASVRTWLARIAVRVAYDHLRRPFRRERATLRLVASEGDAVAPTPDMMLESQRVSERLDHHLASLGPKNRIALILHVVEGRPMAEVAALMAATVAATKTRVFLGRRALLRRVKGDRVLGELLTTPHASKKEVES
jgi:RNA polymerase sigma-70 factor (ECF subfamily)